MGGWHRRDVSRGGFPLPVPGGVARRGGRAESEAGSQGPRSSNGIGAEAYPSIRCGLWWWVRRRPWRAATQGDGMVGESDRH